jgi:hypothetical protein
LTVLEVVERLVGAKDVEHTLMLMEVVLATLPSWATQDTNSPWDIADLLMSHRGSESKQDNSSEP